MKAINLLELLKQDGRFSTLLTALNLTDLEAALEGQDPMTIFAPTDDAFGALPEAALAELIANPEQLKNILLYHVTGGAQSVSDLLKQRRVETLQGQNVWVFQWRGEVYVNRSKVVDGGLQAENGIAHAINAVLLPRSTH